MRQVHLLLLLPMVLFGGVLEDASQAMNAENYHEAMRLYKNVSSDALNKIGYMYGTGTGVSTDYRKAVKYYEDAAELGSEVALHNLATM